MHQEFPNHLSASQVLTPEEVEQYRPEALALLAENYTMYRGFSRQLKADPAIAETYLQSDGYGIADLPEHLQTQPYYAIIALQQNPRAIYRLSSCALNNGKVRAQIKELQKANGEPYTEQDIAALADTHRQASGAYRR